MRSIIAGSARFRALTGTATQGEALERVFVGKAPVGATRPLAIVVIPASGVMGQGRDSVTTWEPRGELEVVLELDPSVASDLGDEGTASKALDRLRTMVAGSASFQALTGSADATAALERVHVGKAPDGATRPLAIVMALGQGALRAERVGVASWLLGGEAVIQYELLAPEAVVIVVVGRAVPELLPEFILE